jgi:hypothetical protein
MKKIFLLLLALSFTINSSRAQSILSFSINPPHPTPTDTITIIADCMFPSGTCDGTATVTQTSGNIIHADAFHCMGMLTVICNDYDTIVIPPMIVGQYSLIFSLSAGNGFPCTPGIVVDDVDTLDFSVEEITGLNYLPDINTFQISPNPSDGFITIKSNSEKESTIKIFSIEGKLIQSFSLNGKTEIEYFLQPGFYLINSENGDRNYVTKIIVD